MQEMRMQDQYIEKMITGAKITTICKGRRDYTLDKIRIKGDTTELEAEIIMLSIVKFGSLDTVDAFKDGYSSTKELKSALEAIYGPILYDDEMTIVYFSE